MLDRRVSGVCTCDVCAHALVHQIYVNPVNSSIPVPPTADCSTNPCTVTNYVYSSFASFDRTSVRLDTRTCFGSCYFIIGLISRDNSRSADFSLVAASNGSIINLADGVSYTDSLNRGQFRYYRFVLTNQTDVQINVNPFYGDPDLYVSWDPNNPMPDRLRKNASSESMYNDTIYIQVRPRGLARIVVTTADSSLSQLFHPLPVSWLLSQASSLTSCFSNAGTGCQLYISVLGFINTSYSIVVQQPGGYEFPIWLVDGVSQSGTVAAGAYQYFAVNLNVRNGTSLSFHMTPTYGDPDLYITMTDRQPSKDVGGSDYSSNAFNYDSVVILPSNDVNKYCSHCIIHVAVYGFSASQFSLTYTTNTSDCTYHRCTVSVVQRVSTDVQLYGSTSC
jgi:hypothetical protein